jgi:glycosyltransferase 2 family protein
MSEMLSQRSSDADAPPDAHKKKRSIALLKIVLFIGVFACVLYVLQKQWRLIDFAHVSIRAGPLVLSVVAMIGVSVVQMVSYRTLLAAYAHAPTWWQMVAIAWVPPMGKYIPGKVAALLAAMTMLRKFGVSGAVAVSVVLAMDGLAVLAGLITGAPLLFWEPIRRVVPWAWPVALGVIICGVVCLWPSVFGRLVNFVLRKLKKQPLPEMPVLSKYLVPVTCAFSQWVLAGISLLLVIYSVTGELRIGQLPLLIAFTAVAQTIGYLALFAPGGIGVREAILLAGLTPLVGPLVAVIVPIRAVAQIVVDLLLALLGVLVYKHPTATQKPYLSANNSK